MNGRELARELREACPDAFGVTDISNGILSIHVPFRYGDGDPFVVLLELGDAGWRLTDGGATALHLSMQHVTWNSQQRRWAIEDTARQRGTKLDEFGTLTRPLSGPPTWDDIAEFVHTISAFTMVEFLEQRRPREMYKSEALRLLRYVVQDEDWVIPDYSDPIHDRNGLYIADAGLVLEGQEARVLTFAVGSAPSVDSVSTRARQFRQWRPQTPLCILVSDDLRLNARQDSWLRDVAGEAVFPWHEEADASPPEALTEFLDENNVPVQAPSR